MSPHKKIFVTSNGCHESRNDAARMQEFFRRNDWVLVSEVQDADIILFKACGLVNDLYAESLDIIEYLKSVKKPSADLIVWGCMPKIDNDLLRKVYKGPTFGPDEFEKLDELFESTIKSEKVHANFLTRYPEFLNILERSSLSLRDPGFFITLLRLLTVNYFEHLKYAVSVRSHPDTFFIKVSTGCLSNCAFCSVRRSRGILRSKPVEKVVKEFAEGLREGYKVFGLIGTDIGSYGRDHGVTLADLLRELVRKEGDYQIKLRNVHPKFLIEMMPELREVFQSGKISYILSGVQSGNNRILRRMNRGYNIEDFKETIRVLNREFPEIRIRTQVIVGFPGETEDEYLDTVRLLDEVSFDVVDVFMYNPRPHTKAALMEDQIPKYVVKRRFFKLYIKSMFNELHRKKEALEHIRKVKASF